MNAPGRLIACSRRLSFQMDAMTERRCRRERILRPKMSGLPGIEDAAKRIGNKPVLHQPPHAARDDLGGLQGWFIARAPNRIPVQFLAPAQMLEIAADQAFADLVGLGKDDGAALAQTVAER